METITYNRENWSGETSTVVINNNGTFKDSVYGKGTWKLNRIEDTVTSDPDRLFEQLEVTVSGSRFTAFKLGDTEWYSGDEEMNRLDDNGIVACLKVASNTM